MPDYPSPDRVADTLKPVVLEKLRFANVQYVKKNVLVEAVAGRTGVGTVVVPRGRRLPARKLIGPIHFALLDCPDDLLARRLRARPAWRAAASPAKITEHQRFAAWLRARITPSFDTSAASATEVAGRVAAWVQAQLPGQPGRRMTNPTTPRRGRDDASSA